VTSEYLVNADDLQIKMPRRQAGEGGQLPGPSLSVDRQGAVSATPGVGLISPPPHHTLLDRGSGSAHPRPEEFESKARIHVKLVAEVGVGTGGAGVAKAHADVVLISGTTAAPAPRRHVDQATGACRGNLAWRDSAGARLNKLRDRIVVRWRSDEDGRDVGHRALLGAEEFGFSTAPLVVNGCIMMRVCHLNTCRSASHPGPECASGSPATRCSSKTSSASSRRKSASTCQHGLPDMDEMIGRVDRLNLSRPRALEGARARPVVDPLQARPCG